MRIMVLGLRGFPDVQGGVETHAEHLYPRLRPLGCETEVIVRSRYMPADRGDVWRGVRFRRIWSPKSKRFEAIVHTALGVLYAAMRRPDVLHIHAIGPAVMTPLARILGLRVVVTHHGPDYERQKWGYLAKATLRLGERFGMRWSNDRIVISDTIRKIVWEAHHRDSVLIPNGVALQDLEESSDLLRPFGLASGKYVLIVSRLVPEKRHHDLIQAFHKAEMPEWKLAIVGGSTHPDEYSRSVLASSQAHADVVCTGTQTGKVLSQLYSHAGVFVLPSSHEGLPIALLEALGFGLPVIASDIPANLEIALPRRNYFPLGDVEELAARLRTVAGSLDTDADRRLRRLWVSERYDWGRVAVQTLGVYRHVLQPAS
jgi:glycosyltransferase involved in cell wall biosynthesis